MIPFLLLSFFYLILGEEATPPPTHTPIPNCYLSTGCANAATCQCTLYLTYCSIDGDPEGKCALTSLGLIVLIGMIVCAVLLVIIVVCCLWCCCLKKCCKPTKLGDNISYHYHTPPSFGGATTFDAHNNL